MAFRIFDAEGRVSVDDSGVDRGLRRVANRVRETVERVDSMEGTATLRADATQVDKEIERTRQKLRSLDRQRATAHADMDTGAFDVAENKLQAKLKALKNERVEIDVRMGRDLALTDRALTGIVRKLRETGRVSPWRDVQRFGAALHNARITLGPLSLSLRGLIIALLALAPIVTAIAGTLGGLTAVLGAGIAGAIGISGAALLGFGALLGGMVGAVVKHKKQFREFKDDVKGLGREFKEQTKIPKSFFDAIREGLTSAKELMPVFTRATNTALDTVGKRTQSFARMIRSGEMKTAFRDLLSNSNEALGPLLRGFSALTGAAARIGASFSRHLPRITGGFRDWANNLLNATRDTKSLDNTVDELMKSLGAVGRLGSSVGRFLANFFMAGARSGRGMLREMTALVNKWAEWAASERGQRQINTFLNEAWDLTKKVAKFIGEAAELISNLATAGRPMVEMLLDAATAVLDFVNGLEDATGLGDELITTLGGLIILRRAVGWASSLVAALGGGALAGFFGGRGGRGGGGGAGNVFAGGAAGAAAGRRWGSGFSQGAKTGIRNTLSARALAGGGAAGAVAAGRVVGGGFAKGAASGLSKAAPLLKAGGVTAAIGFLLDPGDLDANERGAKLMKLGERQSKQFIQGVSKGLGVSRGVADRMRSMFTKGGVEGLRETERQFQGIQRMVREFGATGRKALIHVSMSGDAEVRSRLMELVQTKLGRKLLVIAERGGGQAMALLGRMAKTRIGQKLLNIVQRGGPAAQRIVDKLRSTEIRQKVLRILERGGDDVNRKLNRILGTRLPVKDQRIKETGSNTVIGMLGRIIGIRVPDKTTTIRAEDQASGVIGSIIGFLGSIPRAVTSVISVVRRVTGGGKASGGRPGETGGDPVAPRIAAQAAAARALSMMGGKVFAPRRLGPSVVGEEMGASEFVIPTNPAYRSRARRLLREAVMSIGLPRGHRRGKAPRRYERPKRLRRQARKQHPYLATVHDLQRQIHDRDVTLQTQESRYGTDSQFHPMVDDDGQRIEANIAWHVRALDDLRDRAQQLARLERKLANAIETANKRLHRGLNMIMRRQPRRQIRRGRGRRSRMVDNPEWRKWDRDRQNFQDALSEVPVSGAVDARDRAQQYENTAYGYAGDIRAARETKSAPLAGAGMEAWLAQQGMLGTLQALNLGVAQAAASLGDTTDDRSAQASLAGFWESVINRLGSGGDKELLTEAWSNLASARESASDTGGVPTIESQMTAFDQARTELIRAFGGNMAPSGGGGILGAITGGVSEGVVKGLSGAGAPGGSVGGATPTGGGGGGRQTTINQTNNFAAPPPDPHTFTQSVKWTAQAVL